MGATKFDLIAHPDAIQAPWGVLALFWAISVVTVAIATLSWRFRWKQWRRIHFTIFGTIWCSGVIAATWFEINIADTARTAAQNGEFKSLRGCLSKFHAGKPYASKTVDANEVWTLDGESFEYGAGGIGFAYRTVEPLGGFVHADAYVDVAFVRNDTYQRNEILRLTVKPNSCPRAPDPGPP